ncbi:MAG: CoA ester lyase, partial [Pseudomonadota bacterium]
MKNPSPLRSALYLPASNARAIEKSRTIPADAVIFDLEDAVAPESKPVARQQLASAFENGDFGGSTMVVRANPINTADYLQDLDTIARCRPNAVLLPKVSSVDDVKTFEADAINRGLNDASQAWYMIETAAGLINLRDIISAGLDSRYSVGGLIIGHNDLAQDTGVSLDHGREFLIPWLMQVILYGRHFGIPVLDSVYNNYKDTDGFTTEAVQAKAMGFAGKTLIHPTQVEICNSVFSPSAQELADAKAVIDAFAQPENANAGVVSVGGKMVERLHLKQALAL